MEEKSGKLEVIDDEKWVCDSSMDHKGRVPLRAKTGVWKASLFIIAIEFSERLSYYGIASSLIIYLTRVIHQDIKTAARSVNYWTGVTTLMPLLGGFVADAYIGRFSTVLISSTFYLLGLILLSMSRIIPSLRPCETNNCNEPRKVHEVVFFLAIYLISIGTGGHKPSLESLGADQFDDDHPQERKKKMSYFNWWSFGLCWGLLLGVTVIIYVQEHVSWGVADLILTAVMGASIVIFCAGAPFYRYRVPIGNPLTPMVKVIVAAIAKRNLPLPSNAVDLYEVPKPQKSQGRLLCHTNKLKFLDKAAIIEEKEDISLETQQSQWRLATVTQVEELKLILNMLPIWLTGIPFGICIAQSSTFFIKQAAIMNRKLNHNFLIPPSSIFSLQAIGMIISVTIYERILIPILRRATRTERGIKILQRIGIGMTFSVSAMIAAALIERKRLHTENKSLMSVFWLAPQFLILGLGDGFTLVGLQEYFYDQVPDSMRSLGIALYLSVIGAASFASSLLITVVDHVSENYGKSWFGKDLNSSRLDKFYWLIAAINMVNLCIYVFLAHRHSYKSVQRRVAVAVTDCYEDERVGSMA